MDEQKSVWVVMQGTSPEVLEPRVAPFTTRAAAWEYQQSLPDFTRLVQHTEWFEVWLRGLPARVALRTTEAEAIDIARRYARRYATETLTSYFTAYVMKHSAALDPVTCWTNARLNEDVMEGLGVGHTPCWAVPSEGAVVAIARDKAWLIVYRGGRKSSALPFALSASGHAEPFVVVECWDCSGGRLPPSGGVACGTCDGGCTCEVPAGGRDQTRGDGGYPDPANAHPMDGPPWAPPVTWKRILELEDVTPKNTIMGFWPMGRVDAVRLEVLARVQIAAGVSHMECTLGLMPEGPQKWTAGDDWTVVIMGCDEREVA